MYKDFNNWNLLKKKVENRPVVFSKKREVWWCYFGINIGSEICGKSNLFERPVLVVKTYNKSISLVLPLSSKYNPEYQSISLKIKDKDSFVVFNQIKIISTKRLSRKITKISLDQFEQVKNNFKYI